MHSLLDVVYPHFMTVWVFAMMSTTYETSDANAHQLVR